MHHIYDQTSDNSPYPILITVIDRLQQSALATQYNSVSFTITTIFT